MWSCVFALTIFIRQGEPFLCRLAVALEFDPSRSINSKSLGVFATNRTDYLSGTIPFANFNVVVCAKL